MTKKELKDLQEKLLAEIPMGLQHYRRLYERGLELIKKEPHPKELLITILDDYLDRLDDLPPIDISVDNLKKLDEPIREKVKSLILFGAQAELIKENSDLQKNLRIANQNYQDLLSVVTHEFKNSLTSIFGYNRIIKKRAKGEKNNDVLEISDNIERITRNLFGLVDTLLSMAMIEDGKLQIKRKVFDFNKDVLNPVLDELQYHLKQNKLSVTVSPAHEKVIYYGDEQLFQLVMRNLIQNAIQYGQENTAIEITFERKGGVLQISVFNHGAGIPESKLPYVFEKFSRFHPDGDRKNVGIGLFAVKKIVEIHQGEIEARSKQGEWMEFLITLPMNL